jgi:MFS family permease
VRRIYYGWYVVAMATLVFTVLIGIGFSAFGLFVVPVSKEFGLSRADMNSALILLNLGMALVAPGIGRLLDRFPARWTMIASTLILGASLVTLGLSRSLWLNAFIMALPFAIGLHGAGFLTMTVLIARWFQAQRGRAMALAAMGLSLGGVLGPPVIGLLIAAEGWRTTLVLCGFAAAALLLVLSLMVRERPGPGDLEDAKAVAAGEARPPDAVGKPAKMSQLLRAPQFWTIGLSVALAFAVLQAILISLAPLALGAGFTMVKVTSLVSATAGGAMLGKLLLAVVADRVNRVALITVIFLLVALLNGALFASEAYVALLVSATGLGLASGALTPAFQALLADRFGVASFGTVQGLMAPLAAIISAAAVRFAGEVFDRTGGYDLMFLAFIGTMLAGAALMFATRFFREPQVNTPPSFDT